MCASGVVMSCWDSCSDSSAMPWPLVSELSMLGSSCSMERAMRRNTSSRVAAHGECAIANSTDGRRAALIDSFTNADTCESAPARSGAGTDETPALPLLPSLSFLLAVFALLVRVLVLALFSLFVAVRRAPTRLRSRAKRPNRGEAGARG